MVEHSALVARSTDAEAPADIARLLRHRNRYRNFHVRSNIGRHPARQESSDLLAINVSVDELRRRSDLAYRIAKRVFSQLDIRGASILEVVGRGYGPAVVTEIHTDLLPGKRAVETFEGEGQLTFYDLLAGEVQRGHSYTADQVVQSEAHDLGVGTVVVFDNTGVPRIHCAQSIIERWVSPH